MAGTIDHYMLTEAEIAEFSIKGTRINALLLRQVEKTLRIVDAEQAERDRAARELQPVLFTPETLATSP